MIRAEVSIELSGIEPFDARAAVAVHHGTLAWSGDSFMAGLWLEAIHRAVLVDGRTVGVAGWAEDDGEPFLSLLTLDTSALRHDRQVLERVLAESGARTAYAASWDAHHVAVLGAFGSGMGSQAYQFRLLDPADLRTPVSGLTLHLGSADDLPWLVSTGFQRDYQQHLDRDALSVVRLDGREVGIAMHVPHALAADVVDIGMYVDPSHRRRGLGSSILALVARRALDLGQTPVAGCWWKNWASRPTLEAAGLVCAGTILRFDLDPATFTAQAL
jgi:GNAT superfamily N-acetyltransferase